MSNLATRNFDVDNLKGFVAKFIDVNGDEFTGTYQQFAERYQQGDRVVAYDSVAVLYSPGFGAGWASWAHNDEEEIPVSFYHFCPEMVFLTLAGVEVTEELVKAIAAIRYNYNPENVGYCGGARDLSVEWIAKGTAFRITEYDGSESIELMSMVNWEVA